MQSNQSRDPRYYSAHSSQHPSIGHWSSETGMPQQHQQQSYDMTGSFLRCQFDYILTARISIAYPDEPSVGYAAQPYANPQDMDYSRSTSTASTYGTISPLDPTRLSSDSSMYTSQPLYGQMTAYSQNPYGYDNRTSSQASSTMGRHSHDGSASMSSAYRPTHRASTPGPPSGDYFAQQMQNTHPYAMGMAAPYADQQYLAEDVPSTLVRPDVGTARTTEVAMERRYPDTPARYQCPYCSKNFTKRHNQEGKG